LFILHEEQETTGMQAIYGAHSLKATCGASVVIEQDCHSLAIIAFAGSSLASRLFGHIL